MFEGMSDDQIAIIGCGLAFFVCMGLMVVTHSLRQWGRKESSHEPSATAARRITPEIANRENDSHRKAA